MLQQAKHTGVVEVAAGVLGGRTETPVVAGLNNSSLRGPAPSQESVKSSLVHCDRRAGRRCCVESITLDPSPHITVISRRAFVETIVAAALSPLLHRLDGQRHAPWPGELPESLRSAVLTAMRREAIPGIAIALRRGSADASEGFGKRTTSLDDPVVSSTSFRAASLSKPMFAYGVMTLVRDGLLELDAPLQHYRAVADAALPPRLLMNDASFWRITPRMLLAHTHGIGWRWDVDSRDPVRTGNPFMVREPGVQFAYNPVGYAYLQFLVEHIAGKGLEEFMRTRVFVPLGIQSASFDPDSSLAAGVAPGHSANGVPDIPRPLTGPEKARLRDSGFEAASATSTLVTSAPEYEKLLRAMHDGLAGKPTPIGRQLTEDMLRPVVRVTEEVSWASGWALETDNRHSTFWHYGNLGTSQSIAFADRSEPVSLVVLANSARGLWACRTIASEVFGNARPAFEWMGVR